MTDSNLGKKGMPMARQQAHSPGPMPHTKAPHLLNPLRSLIFSPKSLIRRLDLSPDFSVLELGPGPGYFSPQVAKALPRGKLVLVDVQQEMLDMAQQRLAQRNIRNVEFFQADAIALPLEDESFDVVFLVAVLGEVPDRDGCLREIFRVLRPGGLLSVSEMRYFDPDCIPRSELVETVQAVGFRPGGEFGMGLVRTCNFRKQA